MMVQDKLLKLQEPMLLFRQGQALEDPRDGLTLFGPLDEGRPYGIRPGVIGTRVGIDSFRQWLKVIQAPIIPQTFSPARPAFPGFEAAFRIPLHVTPVAEIEIAEEDLHAALYLDDGHQRVYGTVELFSRKIIDFHLREETRPDIWFVVIPDEVHKYCRPKSYVDKPLAIRTDKSISPAYARKLHRQPFLLPEDNAAAVPYQYDLDFHNQLKARLLTNKIPTQILQESTIAVDFGKQPAFRKLSSPEALKAQVAWNISSAAFYKAGGRPWKIASVRKGVCYLGLTFRLDEKRTEPGASCCGAQMFLDSGDGVVFKGALGPWHNPRWGDFHLSFQAARELIAVALQEYQGKWGEPPSELFIHGKVRFAPDEWAGFASAVSAKTKLVGVRIRETSDLRIYRKGNHPALRGLAYIQDEYKAFLWTRGFIPRLGTYPGKEVPGPLLVEICRGEADMETVLNDILSLTKLNYNACIFSDGRPVTLAFADAVGEILTAGPLDDISPLPFLYYI
jgi:hypothetical protein